MRLLCAFASTIIFAGSPAHAAQVGDMVSGDALSQAIRFFTFADPSVRYALAGSLLLGVCCGVLGGFIVVRRMALVGDALSHAVLPGVALGFLWNMSKDPVAIFIGATLAGLLGTAGVAAIRKTTRLKEDTALGLVLASFFAVGICLLTIIQKLPTGRKSGIDKFLFGQAAAMSAQDVLLMGIVTAVVLALVTFFYKEFLLASFDEGFARVSGLPVRWLNHLLMLLLAFAVVVALQAVGVVLVSAMLITPAAAAYLLTDRMHRLLFIAAAFGLLAGGVGAFLSFLRSSLPTGPLMVLAASGVFASAYFFGPRHGLVPRWWRHRSRSARIERENTLKAIYRVLEDRRFSGESVSISEIGKLRRESDVETVARVRELERNGLATSGGGTVQFTPSGGQRAREIVRNHRLWELYLTNSASIATDHVHDDAEKIEHVLGEDVVLELAKRLNYADRDPHGREIPGLVPETQERGRSAR
ncbi:MAG TPA: iron chelate uptake ABC transporter family permease subunit [Opitutaceae bacterium]|nr:iron chelate uptake ABC transporter family permease subunit [Opitutaceae bacterium]